MLFQRGDCDNSDVRTSVYAATHMKSLLCSSQHYKYLKLCLVLAHFKNMNWMKKVHNRAVKANKGLTNLLHSEQTEENWFDLFCCLVFWGFFLKRRDMYWQSTSRQRNGQSMSKQKEKAEYFLHGVTHFAGKHKLRGLSYSKTGQWLFD